MPEKAFTHCAGGFGAPTYALGRGKGADMSDTGTGDNNTGDQGQQPKTFTQGEMEGIIKERLARERAKYADYESLKEKAAAYDKAEEESKSELDKAQERAVALENELNNLKEAATHRALTDSVSKDTGIPANLLHGDTEDELRASAQSISEYVKSIEPTTPQDKGGGAQPGKLTEEDISKIANPVERVRARAAAIKDNM